MGQIGKRGGEGRATPRHWTAGRMIAMRDEQPGMSLRGLLTACVCGALLAFPVAASAQQAQDDDDDTFEQKIIKNILGGMGVDVGRAGIDYRERSPLVTQPPVGYQTPSSAYPYGAGTDKGSGWKIPTILDRPAGINEGKDQ